MHWQSAVHVHRKGSMRHKWDGENSLWRYLLASVFHRVSVTSPAYSSILYTAPWFLLRDFLTMPRTPLIVLYLCFWVLCERTQLISVLSSCHHFCWRTPLSFAGGFVEVVEPVGKGLRLIAPPRPSQVLSAIHFPPPLCEGVSMQPRRTHRGNCVPRQMYCGRIRGRPNAVQKHARSWQSRSDNLAARSHCEHSCY